MIANSRASAWCADARLSGARSGGCASRRGGLMRLVEAGGYVGWYGLLLARDAVGGFVEGRLLVFLPGGSWVAVAVLGTA